MKFLLNCFCRAVGVVFIFMLCSCAQVVVPNGGPKDKTPPRVLKYFPDSATVNFNLKSVNIVFNEYIQLKDLTSHLIVSPPLAKPPVITVKEKTLNIKFDKDELLKPNSTYVINFGNALSDVNEGNVNEDFRYIFSTGSYIDSLSVSGKVQTAFDHKTEKGILVMLYRNFDDSVIYKNLPDYFTKTKADGTFKITNISPGNYKIMALDDKNGKYKYTDESQSIAFADSLIDATSFKKVSLELFKQPPQKFFLKKYIYNSYGKVSFSFNRGSDSISIRPINHEFNDHDVVLDFSESKDSLVYWFRNIEDDSLILELSNGGRILDTIGLKLIKKADALKAKKNPLKFKLVNGPGNGQAFDLGSKINLNFTDPVDVEKSDENGFNFYEDTIPYRSKKRVQLFFSNDPPDQNVEFGCLDSVGTTDHQFVNGVKTFAPVFEPLPLKENTKYLLFIPPNTITDFFGLTNDTLLLRFKTQEESYYGTLNLKINIPATEQNYIVQLMDEKENVIRENTIIKGETIDYIHLQPHKYLVKIIYDTNKNGKWDTGNLLKKQQAEKIIYFDSNPINIRSNWDMELTWNVKQ